MKAVIYARYSSRTQSEMSIEGQLKECHAFAKREGYTVIAEYIDRAKTAKTDIEKRTQFQKMVRDSSKQQFSAVIIYQFDRFARNRYDSANYKYRLKKNGVRVLSARENISEDASGILMEAMLEGMAEYYSVELSQKVKRGIALSVENKKFIGGMLPIGFKLTEDKHYEIDPVTAPIVKTTFELYSAGYTLKEIGATITEQFGHIAKNPFNYYGRILDNKQYIGTYTRGGHVVPNAIPSIIDNELFEKVRIMRDKKKRTPAAGRAVGDEYILTTKLFCGHCGEMMVGTGGTGKSGRVYHYYGCKVAIKGKGCNKKNVAKDQLEKFIITKAREQLTDENIDLITQAVVEISKQESNTHIISELKRKLKENAKAVDNLMQAIESGEHIGLLSERITKKQEEKASLEKMLANEEMTKNELDETEVKFFLHHLKNGSFDDLEYKRALIAVFVNSIHLYDDGRVRMIFNASDRAVEVDCELLDEIEKLENGNIDGGARCSYMTACTPILETNTNPSKPLWVGEVFVFLFKLPSP